MLPNDQQTPSMLALMPTPIRSVQNRQACLEPSFKSKTCTCAMQCLKLLQWFLCQCHHAATSRHVGRQTHGTGAS